NQPQNFVRRAWATRLATAQLAIRDRTLSARLVRITGTRVPRTRPALSALARKVSCLTSMFPPSSSGASKMSGSPETSETIPFICAASLLMALSNIRGPSRIPPVICSRSAILQRAAASIDTLDVASHVDVPLEQRCDQELRPRGLAKCPGWCTGILDRKRRNQARKGPGAARKSVHADG